MAVDLKLVQWINTHRTKLSRAEVIEQLKEQGYNEQDIVDSYEEVVKKGPLQFEAKSLIATILLSVLIPGAGHMYVERIGTGVFILTLYILGVIFTFTGVGAVIGIPLALAMLFWAVIGSARRCTKINRGELL